ncbi:MAG: flavodoxin-dependent (E)-4-hydroxy-3-methylbut-2-enyl-diphosphate synthase [Armatimonadota bacterium]|nr:flavodoxin-dependent (E)-4-hydroxy-3-methylbut-2-enyl-diphosphate synthase [Armatimonadota bacterium]MDR7449315.1 flavodoxin-dependent (E)-4-hydroxy-3-methylbut-2-enyl-diphosphate synthase [Armatimonadota bacterium]MDR7458762.1 flavodoxin-dependent (E)-4-hydroxy-3-methylbut-2-enyl-diphosphate synthase [Armatimonadota bacterium]MDR7479980.1 flavodoxin-dependent (E)-4-hydroxy-3-methylbut-2-enyl-diphosphate synthase [Armatimonadota bacterium]MDR7488630.1 flavodoxin-dependent (E)-4-hydroxy-3-met
MLTTAPSVPRRLTPRTQTRRVRVGRVEVGGGAPVSVQSMTVTDTRDVDATLAQIYQLAAEGCEIVRVAVPDRAAADALREIVPRSPLPVVADIHFDYRLALRALEAGVAKLRINPGNIGSRDRTRIVARAARERGVPIRIGANIGSLSKAMLRRFGGPTAEALVASALEDVAVLEDLDFHDIVVSVKASDVPMAIEAYTRVSEAVPYPLHVGITEAGTLGPGTVKSAVGIGAILALGIGDTIRVSLAADPVEEVRAGYEILKSLGLRTRGVQLVACPSCGRAEVDIIAIAAEVERRLAQVRAPVKVAVMGCAVNGPGEARMADLGIACGRGMGLLFREGKIVASLPEDRLVDALMEQVAVVAREKYGAAERADAAGAAPAPARPS